MSKQYEILSKRRRRLLMFMAISFMIWQLLTMNGASAFTETGRDWATNVSMLGFFVFMGCLLYLLWSFRFSATIDAATRSALEDEMVQANRARAFQLSYMSTALGAVSIYILTLFVEADGAMVANIIMTIAVTSPMLAFAAAEGENA